jgi:hypothetical protein
MTWMWIQLHGALGEVRHDEKGAVESAQIFAWIVVTVIAIMALGALMQALGVDVINWVRDQIGI